MNDDLISREAAIDALWKALYEYEDKTEKQFQESEDLDVGDWILHRIFVQNMSDIDRQTILNLPSVTPTRPTARWERLVDDFKKCSRCGRPVKFYRKYKHCPECGAKMEEVEE